MPSKNSLYTTPKPQNKMLRNREQKNKKNIYTFSHYNTQLYLTTHPSTFHTALKLTRRKKHTDQERKNVYHKLSFSLFVSLYWSSEEDHVVTFLVAEPDLEARAGRAQHLRSAHHVGHGLHLIGTNKVSTVGLCKIMFRVHMNFIQSCF